MSENKNIEDSSLHCQDKHTSAVTDRNEKEVKISALEKTMDSLSYIDNVILPRLPCFSPLDLLTWTPSDFKKAQIKVAQRLDEERRGLHLQQSADEEQEACIYAINTELKAWEETQKVSAEIEPTWEDFAEQRRMYEARIKELEMGEAHGDLPQSTNSVRARELEQRWLEKTSCPKTALEWEEKIRTILSDVTKREDELETERRSVSDYKTELDLKTAELHGYRARVEGDVRSVAATANELLSMIRNVRNNLHKQKELRDRGDKTAGAHIAALDAMLAAEQVFKPTHELAEKIVAKVNITRDSLMGFWERGDKRVSRVRSPWELLRAIKARDGKIAKLEDEVRKIQEGVARFVWRAEQAQPAAEEMNNISQGQPQEKLKALAAQVAELKHLASSVDRPDISEVSIWYNDAVLKDEDHLISDDEYGNVAKMADKFDKVKSELQKQVEYFQQQAAGYRAARDMALKSLKESHNTCQLLQDEIKSIKDESLPRIEDAVSRCETRHAEELAESQREINSFREELTRRRWELRRKTEECQELAENAVREKKRLLAYKMDRFQGNDAMNPVVKKLLEQADKEQSGLKDQIADLQDAVSALECRNADLKEILKLEKERATEHLDAINSIPALRQDLDEARRAADEYEEKLKETNTEVNALQHELMRRKNEIFDLESEEAEAKDLVAALRSELNNQKENAERKVAEMKRKLEIETARQKSTSAELRKGYRELATQNEELARKITDKMTGSSEPTLLKLALNQRTMLLEQLRALREKYAVALSDNDYATRDAKASKNELVQMKETEIRLRDDHATALLELQSLQEKLHRASTEVQALKARAEYEEERKMDAASVWDDTPVGMSREILESRIETLEENLARALQAAGPSYLLLNGQDGPSTPELKDTKALSNSEGGMYSAEYLDDSPTPLKNTDTANLWTQGLLQEKRLALLRAIRDGDLASGYAALNELDRFLQEMDLGADTDEAWGSVQYLQAYFHLYTTGDIAAAQAAARRARVHNPGSWRRRFYRNLGAKLEEDLSREKEAHAWDAAE